MKYEMEKPIVAVTMGDPAGIGPEICAACMVDAEIFRKVNPILIGDERVLQQALKLKNINDIKINKIQHPSDGVFKLGTIDLVQADYPSPDHFEYGKMSIDSSRMAYSFIIKAIELGLLDEIDSITTSPINKESFKAAGFEEEDHTAIFRKYFKDVEPVSMFHCVDLKVFHYTRHMSLKNAIDALDIDKIVHSLEEINMTLKSVGITAPRIAVAALNPHASDNGMFGDEESKYLIPAVKECVKRGLAVEGPIPADSVFYLQRCGNYDCVLSLYHDQGHIACKTYNFEKSVSLTFGFPFMRSTVDHGTAYNIAGKGIASSANLKEAILVGANYRMLQKRTLQSK